MSNGLNYLLQQATMLDNLRVAEQKAQQRKEQKTKNPIHNLRIGVSQVVSQLLQNMAEIEMNILSMESAGQIPAQCYVGVNITKRFDAMSSQLDKLCELVELKQPPRRLKFDDATLMSMAGVLPEQQSKENTQ